LGQLPRDIAASETLAKTFHWNFNTSRALCNNGASLRDSDAEARSVHVKLGPVRIRHGKFALKATYH
jgi:hypothetical protein